MFKLHELGGYNLVAAPNENARWNAQADYLDPVLEALEEETGGKGAVVFCSDWTDYNWLEWRGWKVLVDARPEI